MSLAKGHGRNFENHPVVFLDKFSGAEEDEIVPNELAVRYDDLRDDDDEDDDDSGFECTVKIMPKEKFTMRRRRPSQWKSVCCPTCYLHCFLPFYRSCGGLQLRQGEPRRVAEKVSMENRAIKKRFEDILRTCLH